MILGPHCFITLGPSARVILTLVRHMPCLVVQSFYYYLFGRSPVLGLGHIYLFVKTYFTSCRGLSAGECIILLLFTCELVLPAVVLRRFTPGLAPLLTHSWSWVFFPTSRCCPVTQNIQATCLFGKTYRLALRWLHLHALPLICFLSPFPICFLWGYLPLFIYIFFNFILLLYEISFRLALEINYPGDHPPSVYMGLLS